MARPLRIEFPGAVYHVTARGDRREDIFVDDQDRRALLDVVAQALSRFDAEALAYCLMGNHWLTDGENREEALYRAHTESAINMNVIARELGPSVSRVSRLIARAEGAKGKSCPLPPALGFMARPWYQLYGSNGTSYSDLANHQNTWETNGIRATPNSAILTDYSGGKRGAMLDPRRLQTEVGRFLGDLDKVYPNASQYATRDPKGQVLAHLENWSVNPLSKGSYTCNRPGYFTTIAGNEARPVDNLYFAGEHTSSFYEWQGFMEGAALSGMRAAGEAFNRLRGK